MFIFFPLHYFFLAIYGVLLYLCLSSSSFFSFWLFMEFATLVFFGVVLRSTLNKNYSSAVVYFLMQSLASMGLIFFYVVAQGGLSTFGEYLFLRFLFIKLGFFPFNLWYFFAMVNLPSLAFFLALTAQKLPPLFILAYYSCLPTLNLYELFAVVVVLTLVSLVPLLLSISGLLRLLILSSLFNNSWIVFAIFSDSLLFWLYFGLYASLVAALVFMPSTHASTPLVLYTLMGFPPFPLFFLKFAVLFTLFTRAS